jgi:hypothetical protein
MSKGSIFSSYKTGENRVTASILAVLQNLSLNRLERILGALMGETSFQLVKFTNQDASGSSGIPDATISASVDILIEAKIVRDALNKDQIDRHLENLNNRKSGFKSSFLLVLTPDEYPPLIMERYNDEPVVWKSFMQVNQAIDEILEDSSEVISEREIFLLRELQIMFEKEDLLKSPHNTVIVAAKNAWPEYQKFGAYICQPNRSFRKVERIGFYSSGQIQPYFPEILAVQDEVTLEANSKNLELQEIMNTLIESGARNLGDQYKIFKLSPMDSERTEKLKNPIINDQTSKTGKGTAYTMGQRYVNLSSLIGVSKTSEIDEN